MGVKVKYLSLACLLCTSFLQREAWVARLLHRCIFTFVLKMGTWKGLPLFKTQLFYHFGSTDYSWVIQWNKSFHWTYAFTVSLFLWYCSFLWSVKWPYPVSMALKENCPSFHPSCLLHCSGSYESFSLHVKFSCSWDCSTSLSLPKAGSNAEHSSLDTARRQSQLFNQLTTLKQTCTKPSLTGH